MMKRVAFSLVVLLTLLSACQTPQSQESSPSVPAPPRVSESVSSSPVPSEVPFKAVPQLAAQIQDLREILCASETASIQLTINGQAFDCKSSAGQEQLQAIAAQALKIKAQCPDLDLKIALGLEHDEAAARSMDITDLQRRIANVNCWQSGNTIGSEIDINLQKEDGPTSIQIQQETRR